MIVLSARMAPPMTRIDSGLIVEERFAVILNGKKIGTVRLDPERRGRVRARMAPLPTFRIVARHRRALGIARERALKEEELTPAELAAADGARAVLDALRLALLTDPGGVPVPTEEVQLLERDPLYLRIRW
jgi:hypothetical protein